MKTILAILMLALTSSAEVFSAILFTDSAAFVTSYQCKANHAVNAGLFLSRKCLKTTTHTIAQSSVQATAIRSFTQLKSTLTSAKIAMKSLSGLARLVQFGFAQANADTKRRSGLEQSISDRTAIFFSNITLIPQAHELVGGFLNIGLLPKSSSEGISKPEKPFTISTESKPIIGRKTLKCSSRTQRTPNIMPTSASAKEGRSRLIRQAPSQSERERGVFVCTGFCNCSICCHKANQPTASGKMPVDGVTVAGPRWFKFGTRLFIEGVGVRVVQDRLARRFEGRLDIYFKDHAAARRFGIRRLEVKVL